MAFKVKNAVNLNLCFVDYVVNFGILKYSGGCQLLLKNGNLAAPIQQFGKLSESILLVGVLIQRRIFYDLPFQIVLCD